MVAIGLRDTLRFRIASRGTLRLQQHFALPFRNATAAPTSGPDNLVLRAAQLLATATGVEHGVEIELLKRIPWQAGLGGGSSDAAATLLALNELWELRLPVDRLHELAAQLGSDLNFFIARTPLALCSGRGERIVPRPLRRCLHLVVAQPEGGLSTADVFRAWRPSGIPRDSAPLLHWLGGDAPHCGIDSVYNALQVPATRLHPGVERLCQQMRRVSGEQALMTGSGSACYVLCRSDRHARCVTQRLRQESGWFAWRTHSTST
jgi:4-diphosphocytidyl-2-C-methyl-D-erythritol kinase